jgi:alpha/beta superfamily hydrolase
MNRQTTQRMLAGPAGPIECAIDEPAGGTEDLRGVAVLCHPHPQHGGTMHNKVVQTLARAFSQLGCRAVRFNFRGVGASGGHWDEGRGEVDDAVAVIDAMRESGSLLWLGGFSFGGYVAAQAAARLPKGQQAHRLVLVAPAVQSFPMVAVPPDTLLIHGETDDVVPLSAMLDWARPMALPVTVVPGAGHFFHGQIALLKNLVLTAFPKNSS